MNKPTVNLTDRTESSVQNGSGRRTMILSAFLMGTLAIARGSSFLMSKQLLETMGPLTLLGIRFLIAFFLLFLIFLKKVLAAIQQDPRILAAALLLGTTYYLCMAAELFGLRMTTAATCSFLENSAIVMVPICEAFLLRRLPSPIIAGSAGITLAGIGLIVFRDGSSLHLGSGELLCIFAALLFTAALIQTDRLSKRHDPFALGILYVGVIGLFGMLSAFAAETPQLPRGGMQWSCILVLSLVCTCLGFTMQPVAQKHLRTETAGLIVALNPLTTAVLGWLLLHESLGIRGIFGAVLIITGILLPNLIPLKPSAPAKMTCFPASKSLY